MAAHAASRRRPHICLRSGSCFETSLSEFEVLRSTGCRCLNRTALRSTLCLFRSNQKNLRRSSRQEHPLQNVTLLLHVSCARFLALGAACEVDATPDCLLQPERATALAAATAVGTGAETALETARIFLFWAGLMASAIRQRSLRRGGTLAGEASGGGWREWCGCSGNALRWLP